MSHQDDTSLDADTPSSASIESTSSQQLPEEKTVQSSCISVPQASLCAAVSCEVSASDSTSGKSEPSIYNNIFWWAYAANLLLVSANTLTFRFAELVSLLGGTQQLAGTIVSIGTIVALGGRLFLGQWIDRFGVRPLWMFTSLMSMAGLLLMIFVPSLGPAIYLGRALFVFGVGGMFACSITHIQAQVPVHRRTEVIGMLGSSGFLGMIVGSQVGDLIAINTADDTLFRHWFLFGTAVVFALIYLTIVFFLTRKDVHVTHHQDQITQRNERLDALDGCSWVDG